MLGFETVGSAIVIVYDDNPILTTDAWINPDAYFGSWGHDYRIPDAQKAEIRRARYHWFSHGHPDHLNVNSLPELSSGTILLSDHYGSRMRRDLDAQGYSVRVLKDFEWVQLSPRVKVLSIANSNQDSCLLIDVGGQLVINLNDAPDLGWSRFIRGIAKTYSQSYLLMLKAWSGADMANFFKPDGSRLVEFQAMRKPIAPRYQAAATKFGARAIIPFSSFHRYQRSDSVWANELVPELDDYVAGTNPNGAPILPAFVRIDVDSSLITPLKPQREEGRLVRPDAFGDNWSDQLEVGDVNKLNEYFRQKEVLEDHFGFITFRVGGRDHTIDLNLALKNKGITFEAPRNSLMTSVNYQVFDDMLIGNFMKTTLHGIESLYPYFSPIVAKIADNGSAQTRGDVRSYFRHYRARDPLGYWFAWAENRSESIFRRVVPENSAIFRSAKKIYYSARRGRI